MYIAWAVIKRDISIALSYRISFVLQFLGIFFTTATFYYLSTLVGGSMSSQLNEYGGSYFPFVLLGIALSTYQSLGLQTFSDRIRESQVMGTLEIMLVGPTRLSAILLASSLWPYIFGSLSVLLLIVLGMNVFGASFAQANVLSAAVILGLSIVSFASIGILSAAFIIVLKRGDPIATAFSWVSSLLSGVFYPPSILPGWMHGFSALLPLTYALDGIRRAVLQGASLAELRTDIFALIGFSIVLLPLALFCFRMATRRAKVEGSLVQY